MWRRGDNGDPCGVPLFNVNDLDNVFSNFIQAVGWSGNNIINQVKYVGKLICV
jgi:hypothetical protein